MTLKWKLYLFNIFVIWLFLASNTAFCCAFPTQSLNASQLDRGLHHQKTYLPSAGGIASLSTPALPSPGVLHNASRLAALAGSEVCFYGSGEHDSIRSLVGYVDAVVLQHALYSSGAGILDNVVYLAEHGVKVILDVAWWDVWPFYTYGCSGWRDLDWDSLEYGLNATWWVKHRIDQLFETIDPMYVWAITLSEEEPALGTPSGYSTPFALAAYYMNYFYDWFKEAYPGVLMFQWPSPAEFLTKQDEYGYYVQADGIAYDNYDKNLTAIREIARDLKAQYPDKPLLFLTAATDYLGWSTPHPPVYTKAALLAVAEYADIVGFFCYGSGGLEGWRDPDHQYRLALELCNQTRFHDFNTVYADTAWFQSIHNDSVTESTAKWY
ncbi:MAG: hypothetical protein ACFFCO_04280, partial [Promethearchaeota archaeon]